jgi:cyclopropane fatty-acyl-phospholipid synthase-like methyltransferase
MLYLRNKVKKSHQSIYNSIINLGYKNTALTYIFETSQGIKNVCHVSDLFTNIRHTEKIALNHLKKRSKIIDIGAGAGRISLYLQKNKFNITALEKSKVICDILEKRGLKKVVNADIFKYFPREKYDTAFFFDTWSILGRDRNSIDRIFTLLKNRLLNKENSIFFVFQSPFITKDSIIRRRFIFNDQESFWFKSYFFDSKKLISIGENHGWRVKKLYVDSTKGYFLIMKNRLCL